MLSLTKARHQAQQTHHEGQKEGDWTELSKELSSIGCVCFCNGTENLGLCEVSSTGEQYVPSVGKFEGLEHIENGEKHSATYCQNAEHQQPRLVSETCGHKGDGQGEDRDEQERLKASSIKHEVELWVAVEWKRHQEIDGKHRNEQNAQCR